MQYKSQLALLAVALFSTSVLAAPFDADSELEVREADNEIAAREYYDASLEAREDFSLDARDVEDMDLEAREYLEDLEAREPASASTRSDAPQTPMSSTHDEFAQVVEYHQAHAALKKAVFAKFQDVKFYHEALTDKTSKYHRYAVAKHLQKPKNLKKALANKKSPYHKVARRIAHRQKAKAFLADKKHYKYALSHKHSKFHKDAVNVYLSDHTRFQRALTHKRSHFHKVAVHQYLLNSSVRKEAIQDSHNPHHKAAVRLQKKINHHKKLLAAKHSLTHSESHTESHAPATHA